jgi:CheY-like chemotaxis protein/two-component sensor histidine kinase
MPDRNSQAAGLSTPVPVAQDDEVLPSNQFLAALSHEMRNPLGSILNATHVLRASNLNPQQQQLALDAIERQAIQLTHVIDSLVDAARLRRGELNLSLQPVDAAALAQQAIEAVKFKIDSRRQALYVTLPAEPVLMKCDPGRLLQIIQNLLDNACRYTPELGSIALTVKEEAEQLSIVVSDNGYGVEPELLPHLFNLFATMPEDAHAVTRGLGVGLAITRNLVELHGGSIVAQSDGVGQGTRFTVRLPLHKLALPSAESAEAAGSSPARKILIVEDDDRAAADLIAALSTFGYEIMRAADCASAILRAKEFVPEVVIIDIGLPDGDGYEVACQLRSLPEVGGALLIAASGYHLRAFRQVSDHMVFDHYLLKPVSPATLTALIEHTLTNERRGEF